MALMQEEYGGSDAASRGEEPILLFYRAISGIIDLIVIALIMYALLIAADIYSGLSGLDAGGILNYALLFLLVYFLYSLFFFGMSCQTIGMMVSNLRIISTTGKARPGLTRVFLRCCAFLLSVVCLGCGLIWALFDREHRCFHDRLTRTRVVSI